MDALGEGIPQRGRLTTPCARDAPARHVAPGHSPRYDRAVADTVDSGERADVAGKPVTLVHFEHVNRYTWAQPQVSGRILDVACGTGYGSALLARSGNVTGLDKHAGAIEMARGRAPQLDFQECVLPPIPFADGSFDAVVTFETVEHIDDDVAYIAEVHRVLKRGGLLLLSTPNAAVSSPSGSIHNPWHVREYTLDGLRALLGGFDRIEIFMQGPVRGDPFAHAARWVLERFPGAARPRRWLERLAYGNGAVQPWDGRAPWYWVVRARRRDADAG